MAIASDKMNKSKKGANSAAGSVPGDDAQKPSDIPAKGWLQILKRGWKEASVDQVPLLAAGVAFFGFLSLFPAMIALVLVYGLIADPATVAQQVGSLTKSLPPGAGDLISGQLTTLTSTPPKSLGFGLVLSILIALWSASGGVGQLITAVNTAYDEEVKRGFVKQKLLALGMTLAAIVFMVLMIGLVAVAPVILENLVGSGPLRWLLAVAQYALLIIW